MISDEGTSLDNVTLSVMDEATTLSHHSCTVIYKTL